MLRFLIACVFGLGIFGLVAWYYDLIPPGDTTAAPPAHSTVQKSVVVQHDLGRELYPAVPMPPWSGPLVETRVDPVVVVGTMSSKDRPDIAAQMAGQIMFIGDEVPEGAVQVAGAAAFLADPFGTTRVNNGVREIIKIYRRLQEGDMVYPDQILAMVDTAKSLGDLEMKHSKVISAEADAIGAKAIAEEASVKYGVALRLFQNKSIAEEDLRSAKLTQVKMYWDSVGKEKALDMTRTEEKLSLIIYHQHEIRNKNAGPRSIIQKIYRQRGEAVKELEPIMQLYSLDPLSAEAQIDAEYYSRLREGMAVTLEPSVVDAPPKTYSAHVAAVNCLGVTKDPANPLIVSGSEDRTVLVWQRYAATPIRKFEHPEAVKALACSPRGAQGNLLLTGCADGAIRLYDLSVKDDAKAMIKEAAKHSVAITALAFSPDGKYFASGAADGTLTLWSTDKIEPLYVIDERHGAAETHHNAVTSLNFTPQCKLISSSLDNVVLVWSLKEKGASLDYSPLAGRSGSVNSLDVSADGRLMLFDQGKTMQIRAVSDGHLVNSLRNPGGVIPFETLAMFAPDASLLLTAGAPDGKLQLWHVPADQSRGFEIRKFATRERAPVTCAAFAPMTDYHGEGTFAVSANKDGQIYLWPLPSTKEIANYAIRDVFVHFADGGLNASTGQRIIKVEVPNPPTTQNPKGRLEPGRQVTFVIN